MPRPRSRATRIPPLVTLTSDIGSAYAAQMKAVLARRLPPGHVVDLAHDLSPHRIVEAAFLLRAMASGFPAGTVHVAVIDPGVGGRRAPIVVECADGSCLVGPDNGVLAPLAEALGTPRAWRIEPTRLPDPARVGATFDGRDVFAPAAAAVALGTRPSVLGPPHRLRALQLPVAEADSHGARGEILSIDRFGNLITNVPSRSVPRGTDWIEVRIGRTATRRLAWVAAYEDLPRGASGVLASSFGTIEIARREGRASTARGARVGARVAMGWPAARRRGPSPRVRR